jgi:hypothetical protein
LSSCEHEAAPLESQSAQPEVEKERKKNLDTDRDSLVSRRALALDKCDEISFSLSFPPRHVILRSSDINLSPRDAEPSVTVSRAISFSNSTPTCVGDDLSDLSLTLILASLKGKQQPSGTSAELLISPRCAIYLSLSAIRGRFTFIS